MARLFLSGIFIYFTTFILHLNASLQNIDYMKNLNSWDFNVWECKDEELGGLASSMFLPFLNLLTIEKKSIDRLVSELQKNYHNPPYHNFRHALEVAQFIYKMDQDGLLREKFTPIERFTLILTAFGHDLGHPGKNNSFQVEFKTPLYDRFGANSTLEKFHIDGLIQIIRNSEIGLLKNLPASTVEQIERMIHDLIIPTDMALHDDYMQKIKKSGGNSRFTAILIMKCADLGHIIRPKFISDRWKVALYEEQFLQRKEEKARGIDDHICDVDFAERQIQFQPVFIKKFVVPLFEELFTAFPEMRPLEARLQAHLASCEANEKA